VLIVDTNTGKTLTSFSLPCCGRSVAFAPDGNRLAVACGQDGLVRIHEPAGGKLQSEFQVPGGKRVFAVEFAPDGKRLLTACGDGATVLWDVSTPQARAEARMEGHEGAVWWARFLPDGRTALTGGEDRTIRRWRLDRAE